MQSAIKYTAIAAMVLMSACVSVNNQDVDAPATPDPTPGTVPVTFCARANDDFIVMPQSRSKDPLTQDNIGGTSQLMGVYAFYTEHQKIADCADPKVYSSNHLFYHFDPENIVPPIEHIWRGAIRLKDTDGKILDITKIDPAPLYWPLDRKDNLTFFAYAPYDDCAAGEDPQIISATIDPSTKKLIIEYRPDNVKIQRQLDLSFAKPVIDKNREADEASGPVPLEFKKSLTRVQFYARYQGDLPAGFRIRIVDITLKNILGQRTVEVDPDPATPPFSWIDPVDIPENRVDYYMAATSDYLENVDLKCKTDTPEDPLSPDPTKSANYTTLTNLNGILLLVPQTITSTSKLVINYNVYNGTTYITTIHDEVPLPAADWAPGQVYGYYITLLVGKASEVDFESSVEVDGTPLDITYEEFEDSGSSTDEIIIP